jgi:hypothetical protein
LNRRGDFREVGLVIDNPVKAKDYRCVDGRFELSECGVLIVNSRSVSSRETEVRNGIKSWKAHLFSSAKRKEAIGGL